MIRISTRFVLLSYFLGYFIKFLTLLLFLCFFLASLAHTSLAYTRSYSQLDGALYPCWSSCGNYFHAHCLLTWVRHNTKPRSTYPHSNSSGSGNVRGAGVTCPLCRAELEWAVAEALAEMGRRTEKIRAARGDAAARALAQRRRGFWAGTYASKGLSSSCANIRGDMKVYQQYMAAAVARYALGEAAGRLLRVQTRIANLQSLQQKQQQHHQPPQSSHALSPWQQKRQQ